MRLAPAFAVRHGINPYPLLGEGPLFTWIYGPTGIFVNLPATFATTAKAAVQTACAINLLTVLGPLAIIFFGSAELRARGFAAPALALALATLLVPRATLLFQVADHSAIALGLLSCWCLARDAHPSGARLCAAAALCAFAIWAKQISVLLLLAQIVFLLFSGERTAAVRYTAWVALFGFAALGAFVALFGFENLWLNLVAIPGRLPWTELWPRLTMRTWPLVAQIVVPALLLFAIWRKGLWPTKEREQGRFFQIAVLAAAAMLPIGLVAFFKIGGDTNSLHSSHYLLPAFLLAWLTRDTSGTPAATFRLLAVLTIALAARTQDLRALPAHPGTRHFDSAVELAAAYPNALWFPQNPVLTFYLDGSLWHSEDGVLTRYAADHRIREPDFRRHLPRGLKGAVYPATVDYPFAMPLLAEFNQTVRVPYWKLHLQATPPAAIP